MIVDAKAREQALSPTQSFIVQAPAGSGKTGLLVYRYLTLLATVNNPQNVLAITFTRKAKSEMRERVLHLLLQAQDNATVSDTFEQQGIDLARRVLDRDQTLGWMILEASHQLQILTIDAFSSKLAASMPWLSRLGDMVRTTDLAEPHYEYSVDQVLDTLFRSDSELGEHLNKVLMELDYNYAKAKALFVSMLAKRDQWLRHIVPHNIDEMRTQLDAAWGDLCEEQLRAFEMQLSPDLIASLMEIGCMAARNLKDSGLQLSEGIESLLHVSHEDQASVYIWQGLAELILTKDGKIRSRLTKKEGFPANSELKNKTISVLGSCVANYDEFATDLFALKRLPSSNFSETDWSCLLSVVEVLKSLAAHLQLRFRSVGEVDHSEVTQRANLALSEIENPTDLGLMMDAQIHHILVDEFQDTSSSQLELLQNLTSGWERDAGPSKTLFLVGDPMQSIYRFREADVGLFLQVVENERTQVFPDLQIKSLVLRQNFRSSQELVSWFNNTFSASFPQQNDVLTGAISYSEAEGLNQSDFDKSVDYLLFEDKDQEARRLAELVNSLLAEQPDDSQIAILVRSRTHLDNIMPALKQAAIPYVALDIQALHEHQAVIDVVTLAYALSRPSDRIAWLSLLRGPWCGMTLSELKSLTNQFDVPIFSQICDPSRQSALNEVSKARLGRFVDVITKSLNQFQQVNFGALVRWTWERLGGQLTLGNLALQDLDQVFSLLEEIQRCGTLVSRTEFESRLRALTSKSQDFNQARVIVSTIHKAKGLQYHTVIIPSLSSAPRNQDKEVLMWAERQTHSGRNSLLLAPLLFDQPNQSHYSYLRDLEKQRSHEESKRLMYVACTRAEQRLVISGVAKQDKDGMVVKPRSGSLLEVIWSVTEYRFALEADQKPMEEPLGSRQVLSRLDQNFVFHAEPNFQWRSQNQLSKSDNEDIDQDEIDYDWATEVARSVGTILHEELQFRGSKILNMNVDLKQSQKWRALLQLRGVPAERFDYAIKRLILAVQNIQADSQARFIFKDYFEQENEMQLSAMQDGAVVSFRLDRTFVDETQTRWIVDYKSTTTNTQDTDRFVDEQVNLRHKKQLEKYAELMSQIDARPIKLAVYFPLLKQLRIWDYCPQK